MRLSLKFYLILSKPSQKLLLPKEHFFFADYWRLTSLSRHKYSQRSRQAISDLSVLKEKEKEKKVSLPQRFGSSEHKIQEPTRDLFYSWLYINFSSLPNLSVFQTICFQLFSVQENNYPLSNFSYFCLGFLSCPLISFLHKLSFLSKIA